MGAGRQHQVPRHRGFLQTYRARASQEGVDPLGTCQPPFAYAAMQILEQAIAVTGTLDDGRLARHMHATTFPTVVGDIAFDASGEWAQSRVLTVQFRGIKGSGLDQYMRSGTQAILYRPPTRTASRRRSVAELAPGT